MQQRANFNVTPLTPAVKRLIAVNIAVWFIIQVLLKKIFPDLPLESWFSLVPEDLLFQWKLWQPFTYMFLHSTDGITHITFNMLMLWMFGGELEQIWGRRHFLIYYLVCGVGAAVLYSVLLGFYAQLTGQLQGLIIPVVGASGAIYGLMLAHALLFGERMVLFFMLFPIKTKYFVLILGFIQFASLITSSIASGGVSYLAHLGGLASGFIYLWFQTRMRRNQQEKKRKNKGNLRLVVDNESNKPHKPEDKNPRYWN